MKTYNAVDYFDLNSLLSEDEKTANVSIFKRMAHL
jgi:hypothetical protein